MRVGSDSILKLTDNIYSVLYPSKCVLCGRIIESRNNGVCDACYEKLPFIETARCVKCSKSITEDEIMCSDCSRIEHLYTQGFAMWRYDKTSKKIISRLKYDGVRDLSVFISNELSYRSRNIMKKWNPDAIMPVPLHPSKMRRRGFNQAALIAEGIGSIYGIKVIDDVLIRQHKTYAQKNLDNRDRMRNLEGVFIADSKRLSDHLTNDMKSEKPHPCIFREDEWSGDIRSVIVTDDIYTTGSTIDGCAHALRECGVEKVYFLCACIGMGF